ncbi:sensor histidine kinase [Nitrosococcus watsonii]|uniref:histidine kinase n=1 Tax=Nitrosococcus watsoni (strain C-113) TaxID=105559 RepID=D8K4J2_NITWC|nr:ATP-binding protein [Nitrosococcus watsonii]ADJ29794.1 integral membrane sensor signal transduction histidine kinase [Nitrosococcus watsonii C-113]
MVQLVTRIAGHLNYGYIRYLTLGGLLLLSFYLLAAALEDSAHFGRLYLIVLGVNILALLLLLFFIGSNLIRLIREYRERQPGSRLTVRVVAMFISLTFIPLIIVFSFSLQFLHRGIESWFNVQVEKALEDSLELSRTAFGIRMRTLLKQTQLMAATLAELPLEKATYSLQELRYISGAHELTLLNTRGQVITSATHDPETIVPDHPNDVILFQLRQGQDYVALDPVGNSGLHLRAVVNLPATRTDTGALILQALFPIADRLSTLADSVQDAYDQYKQLAYLRRPLIYSFTLTLSLIVLLTLLAAVWTAFFLARRLASPVTDLAQGTRAVARGDYDTQLPSHSHDELGFLVDSFNQMTRRLSQARDAAHASQQQLEKQRRYLKAVLGSLSSGVITLDNAQRIRTANITAGEILSVDLHRYTGQVLERIARHHPEVQEFIELLHPYLKSCHQEWRKEIIRHQENGRQFLMCRGAPLPGDAGQVIVFDDATAFVQAQRNAAWGEVARRLAHEIKNPLTPIQLSAERLRRKYLKCLPADQIQPLDRLTHTIIAQVEAMKEMVNAFSEYARNPALQQQSLDFNSLVKEVLELYRGDENKLYIEAQLAPQPLWLLADPSRLRQLLHNLLKNALEAMANSPKTPHITVQTRHREVKKREWVELQIIDQGPGIPPELCQNLFEPYVSTRPKGTGLGLAIVKRIVEEQGGYVSAKNLPGGGACLIIQLPCQTASQPLLEIHR